MGKFYATQGFALKAIAVYKQIREIIAKHVPTLEERYAHITPKLAELYQQLGLTSDALAALDEVATRFQRQGRDAEAIEVFRKIVELDPTNPLPHLRLAEALSRVKDVDGAVEQFGIAANQLAKLGRRDDAIKVIERLLHHKSDVVHARIAAELYLSRNTGSDGLQALSKLQVCFQANPKDIDTLALLARAFTAIGQAAKAIEVQKEMARIAKEQGKTELFKQLIEKLLRLAPNDEGVKALLAAPVKMESSQPPPAYTEPNTRPAIPPAAAAPEPARHGRAPSESSHRVSQDQDDSYEVVPDGVAELEAGDEQPFEMRRSDKPQSLAPEDFQEIEQPSNSMDVVIEPSYRAAEEVSTQDAPSANARARLARILADAGVLRRQRFYAKAIETLRSGIEVAPRSVEVREVLRDVLLEAGRHHEALGEMLGLASLQIDTLDGDGAATTLQDVLAMDPQNIRAQEMLRELGYELVEEGAPSVSPPEYQDYDATGPPPDLPPMRPELPSYDPEAPLPSYDLEGMGPEDVAPRAYSDPAIRAAARDPGAAAGGLGDIDDPFGDGPLPSFPLDPPAESEASFDLVATRPESYEQGAARVAKMASQPPTFELDAPLEDEELGTATAAHAPAKDRDRKSAELRIDARPAAPKAPTPPPAAPSSMTNPAAAPFVGAELEEALEEAEFFTTRGLFDDARTILEEQLSRLPNHPLLVERLAELDAQERGVTAGSGPREMPAARKAVSFHPQPPPGEIDPVDRAFDIAETLGAMEEALPAEGLARGPDQQVDVEEVFAKFKEGVAKQISVDDAQPTTTSASPTRTWASSTTPSESSRSPRGTPRRSASASR